MHAMVKVRAYEPNSLIMERADVFVRIHVVPTEQLIRVSGGKVEPTAYILDTYVIGNNVVKIREYLNNHEFGKIHNLSTDNAKGSLAPEKWDAPKLVKLGVGSVSSLLRRCLAYYTLPGTYSTQPTYVNYTHTSSRQ
jgi:hypothetical protein